MCDYYVITYFIPTIKARDENLWDVIDDVVNMRADSVISVCRKVSNPWHSFLRCPTVILYMRNSTFNPPPPIIAFKQVILKLFRYY